MKTNLETVLVAVDVDSYCTDEFFDKIYFDKTDTFRFLYAVLVQFNRRDIVEKYKDKINFDNINKMPYSWWQALGSENFDFLCSLKTNDKFLVI